MILRPQKNFTVVRQLANHTDTATYYVRAVIRDAFTDEILATLDLDSKGGQRFSKAWLVAADVSGQGRDISIVTSVYTNSGYTTKSENYGDEENTHIIENANFMGGGVSMGGGKLDSATIRRIFVEEFKKIKEEDTKEPEGATEAPEPEDTRLIEKLDEVLTAVKAINIPEVQQSEKVDLQPILNGMSTIYNAILDKEVTPPTDLNEVKTIATNIVDSNRQLAERVIDIVKGTEDVVQEIVSTQMQDVVTKEIKNVFSKLKFVIPFDTLTVADKPSRDGAAQIDIDSLAK